MSEAEAPPKQYPHGKRGFASMDPEKQRAIASKGGKAAHQPGGGGHEFTPGQASDAARIGHQRGTAHEFNTDEARKAGKKGGIMAAFKKAKANKAWALCPLCQKSYGVHDVPCNLPA